MRVALIEAIASLEWVMSVTEWPDMIRYNRSH